MDGLTPEEKQQAEDTVMNPAQISSREFTHDGSIDIDGLLEDQAEISFKAGKEAQLAKAQDGEQGLMKVLVEGGIILKDATPTYSELLSPEKAKEAMGDLVVPEDMADHWWELTEKLLKAQLAHTKKLEEVCPECDGAGMGRFCFNSKAPCETCQGTGKAKNPDRGKVAEALMKGMGKMLGMPSVPEWDSLADYLKEPYLVFADQILELMEGKR